MSYSRAWTVAILLAALSVVSFLDRQILALLVPDLARELAITDVQFGWLIGPAFILIYNITLLPAAVMVDRWNRKRLLAAGVIVWSLMTIASGFATTFSQLLVLRAGLAFGEALLGPAAISLIGDMFARTDRPLPTATYIAGSVIGGTGSAMLGAAILQWAGTTEVTLPWIGSSAAWRLTLIMVGIPGLVLATLFLIIAKEPRRGVDSGEPNDPRSPTLLEHLRQRGLLYAGTFIAIGIVVMIGTGIAVWGPTHLIRSFGLSQVHAGYWLGSVSLLAGIAGTLTLPVAIRRLLKQGKVSRIVLLTVICIVLTVLAAVASGFATSLAVALIGVGFVMFLVSGIGTLPTLFVQLYAPSHLRGRITAGVFFMLYILASGLGPVLIPTVAQHLFAGQPTALGRSLGVIAVVSGVIAAVLFASIRRRFEQAEAEAASVSN